MLYRVVEGIYYYTRRTSTDLELFAMSGRSGGGMVRLSWHKAAIATEIGGSYAKGRWRTGTVSGFSGTGG
jgi:hypothetical protein